MSTVMTCSLLGKGFSMVPALRYTAGFILRRAIAEFTLFFFPDPAQILTLCETVLYQKFLKENV